MPLAQDLSFPADNSATDLADSDSDGDGVRDGADDQDHDDVPNLMELRRSVAASEYNQAACTDEGACGFINPFNPCLPNPTRGRARGTRR